MRQLIKNEANEDVVGVLGFRQRISGGERGPGFLADGFGRGLCFDCEDPIEWPPGTPMRPRKICRRCAQVEFLQADLGYRR